MLLPDELGPVMTFTLLCDSELWKELATNTGEHNSNSGCLEDIQIQTFMSTLLHSHTEYNHRWIIELAYWAQAQRKAIGANGQLDRRLFEFIFIVGK